MEEGRGEDFGDESWNDGGQEDDGLRSGRTDEIEGRSEDDHVQDIVDQTCGTDVSLAVPNRSLSLVWCGRWLVWNNVPNNQNATQTFGSAPSKRAANRARYMAHDAEGEPGNGSIGS